LGEENSNQPDLIPESDLKKPVFWRWFWCVLILLIVLVFWTIGSQFRAVPLRISKETTYFTEPLKPDGKSIDYLAALENVFYSDRMDSEDNGYRLLVEHFGETLVEDPVGLESIRQKLGLDFPIAESKNEYQYPFKVIDDYIDGPGYDVEWIRKQDAVLSNPLNSEDLNTKVYDKIDAREIFENRLQRPWTVTDIPTMKSWLEQSRDHLDVVSIAVRKPIFEIPILSSNDEQALLKSGSNQISNLRSLAWDLVFRSYFRLGIGDVDGAIHDVATCKLLGRHLQNGHCMAHRMVGIAIESIGNSIGLAGWKGADVSREQIKEIMAFESIAPKYSGTDKLNLYHRCRTLEGIMSVSRMFEYKTKDDELKKLLDMGVNWNIVANVINKEFDFIETDDEVAVPRKLMDYALISRRSKLAGLSLSPRRSFTVFREEVHRIKCENQIRQISLAMLLYEKDHGTLPPAFTVDDEGKPLHSWRVLLLPYLGQQQLYDHLELSEPWNSPHNKKYWAADIPIYQCPSDHETSPGRANYSVVVGDDSAFRGTKGTVLNSIVGNPAGLVLVIERLEGVCWLDPNQEVSVALADLGINQRGPSVKKIIGVSSDHKTCVVIGCRDGSVKLLSDTQGEDLRKMVRGKYFGRR